MGEFARRLADGQEIKIGTCEEMLYLRFEDRHLVGATDRGHTDVNDPEIAGKLLYRLPYPDEDDCGPGNYKEPFRTQRLYDPHGNYFTRPELADQTGTMQLHQWGLLLNVPCHHGEKLPVVAERTRAFWNGKEIFWSLAFLRATWDGRELHVHPVIQCKACRRCWRTAWSEIIDYIPEPMRERVAEYARLGMLREIAELEAREAAKVQTRAQTA
jgi:hypothetical protein